MLATLLGQAMPVGHTKHTPHITGHRGAAGLAPENTLSAFRKAIELNLDGVEFDIQRASDGEIVVFHDETLDRTTTGTGELKDFTLDELRKLDAGYWFDPRFQGEPIPTLKEVFELLKPSDLILHIELKSPYLYMGIEAQVAALIRDYDLTARVQVRSFYHPALHTFYQIAPEIAISELWYERIPNETDTHFRTINALHSLYTEENIADSHKRGQKVTAWTVNDTDIAKRLIMWGIDGLTTDRPDLLLPLVS
jgi:glycerophosphoryl diester phosphodiesterase